MALAPTGDGYSILYYHALSSGMEFSVNTRLLRDPQRASAAGRCIEENPCEKVSAATTQRLILIDNAIHRRR